MTASCLIEQAARRSEQRPPRGPRRGLPGLLLLLGLLYLLCLAGPAAAQFGAVPRPLRPARPRLNHDYDSLARTLPQERTDTGRLRVLRHLLDLRPTQSAALPLLDEVLRLGQKHLKSSQLAPYAAQRRGLALWLAATDDEAALQAMQQAVLGFGQQRHPVPRLLIDLAPLFNRLNQPKRRLRYYAARLEAYRVANDSAGMGACYVSLGGQYRRLGDFNRTISYFLRAGDMLRHSDQHYYLNCLAVVGACYVEWGNRARGLYHLQRLLALPEYGQVQDLRRFFVCRSLSQLYLRQGDYPAALRYARAALAVPNVEPSQRAGSTAQGLVLVSAALLHLGPPAAVRPLLLRAQQLSDSLHLLMGAKGGELELDATWAQYYEAIGDDKQAEARWQLAYAKATASKLDLLRTVYLQRLNQFYDRRHRPAEAQRYARQYLALADSSNTDQGRFRVASYESERVELVKNAQIAAMRQQQAVQAVRLRLGGWLLAGAVLAALLASGLGVLIYRQLRANRRTLRRLHHAQHQLVQSEKMAFLGELSAGIAHELQNPLAFMKTFADVSAGLVDDMAGSSAPSQLGEDMLLGLKQNLRQISQHGQRASAIIRDMLVHARGSSEQQLIDLNALAAAQLHLAAEPHWATGAARPVARRTALDPALPPWPAFAADLGRAVLNLCQNALYAAAERGRTASPGHCPEVCLSTRPLAGGVELAVADNGPGMAPAVLNQIFRPFFTTKPESEGTGLGLSLSHDIVVKGHGGTLTVTSTVGEGSCFRLWLPPPGPAPVPGRPDLALA